MIIYSDALAKFWRANTQLTVDIVIIKTFFYPCDNCATQEQKMIACIIAAVLVLWTYIYFRSRKPKNLPPGPPALPIVGNIPHFFKSPPFKKFMEWREKYGDTILIYFGGQFPTVVMHDYDTMKKVFNDDVTAGRDQRFILNRFFQGRGLIVSQGDLWKEHRRFTISALRDFGMGKTWLEDNIIAEVEDLCNVLRKQNQQPFDPKTLLTHSVSNVICALVFGKRFNHSDAKFTKLSSLFAENVRISTGPVTQIIQTFPVLEYIPGYLRRAMHQLKDNMHKLYSFANQRIHEHKNSFESEKAGDYIDAFIKEAKEQQQKGVVHSTFTDKQLATSVLNLFAAGTETTSTTMLWAFVFLLENPEVMHAVQKEIDNNVPRDEPVRMDHKGLLPCTEATISEIQRCASLLPMGVFHQAMADMIIDGYTVPKGTLIIPNLYSMHHDPRYWNNPDKFDPNRFLDENGKVNHPAGFAPFQVGKRACLGEALAKMELYLFIANVLKNFSLENAPGKKVSHEDFVASILLEPAPFKVVFVPR